MRELIRLAAPLRPCDRRLFVEDVVAELNGHAEIDVGLVHRVGARLQRQRLGFVQTTVP
jgi:hypothetical protein